MAAALQFRFDSFISLRSSFMVLLLQQFDIYVSGKFSHNSLYEQFNYVNYYIIVIPYKPQVDLDTEIDEEFLTALFLWKMLTHKNILWNYISFI